MLSLALPSRSLSLSLSPSLSVSISLAPSPSPCLSLSLSPSPSPSLKRVRGYPRKTIGWASSPSAGSSPKTRRRCAHKQGPGADVGSGGPSPGADVAAVRRVPAQMWQRRAESRCRCASGEPSPSRPRVSLHNLRRAWPQRTPPHGRTAKGTVGRPVRLALRAAADAHQD